MSGRLFKILVVVTLFLSAGFVALAQDGAGNSYSPYSVFGIGDILKQGNSYTKTMGGVGVATRNTRYINHINPASLTARDTLSFMMDFGIEGQNKIYSQADMSAVKGTFNITDIIISFPLFKNTAMSLGVVPFSSVAYDVSYIITDKSLISQVGDLGFTSSGNGGLYQGYVSVGTKLFGKLSIGAEAQYYFGNIDKTSSFVFNESSYRSIKKGNILNINAFTGKFGMQYEQTLENDLSLTVGATYRLGSAVKGKVTEYTFATISNLTDTLSYEVNDMKGQVRIADEIGVGVSLKKGDKWRAEINYLRSGWHKSGFDNNSGFSNTSSSVFSTVSSESYRAGFELIPNRNDIRYYLRRCSYRAGLYYDKDYFKLNGNQINSYGLTLGVTLPVFRWYNGLSVGVDLGQRGSHRDSMTRELYGKVILGFNIHDIWFQKPKYD